MARLTELSAKYMAQRRTLLAYSYAMLQDYNVAEDVVQEVYLEMAQAVESGVDIVDLDRWCRGVARNKALKMWRSQRRSKVILAPDVVQLITEAFDEREEETAKWERRSQALALCLEELNDEHRSMLKRKYLDGWSADRIATQVQRTRTAVFMLLARLRKSLQDCIAKRLKEAEA